MAALDDIYLLARDVEETDRLNEQHKIFVINNGYTVHPTLAARLPHAARVADVAAGSGAWTLGTAKLLSPEAQVDGFDISDSQFPKEHPPNVSFSVHNAKQPFAEELHGKYDLVHVRALIAAMNPSDWQPVMENLKALLKPGGSLQWTEADLFGLRCLRGNEAGAPFLAIPKLLGMFDKASPTSMGYTVDELPNVFEKVGLHSVQTDIISSDRVASTRTALTVTYLVAILGWARKTQALPDSELDDMKLNIQKEIEAGAYVRGDTLTIIGIK